MDDGSPKPISDDEIPNGTENGHENGQDAEENPSNRHSAASAVSLDNVSLDDDSVAARKGRLTGLSPGKHEQQMLIYLVCRRGQALPLVEGCVEDDFLEQHHQRPAEHALVPSAHERSTV